MKHTIKTKRVLSRDAFSKDCAEVPGHISSRYCHVDELSKDYFVYNLTNALAVVQDGARPEMTEIRVPVDVKVVIFNVEWANDENGDEYVKMSSWHRETVAAGFEDIFAQEVVHVNLIYLAGVSLQAGAETSAFIGRSSTAMERVNTLFNSTLSTLASQYCTAYSAYVAYCTSVGQYCAYANLQPYCDFATPEQSMALFGNASKVQRLLTDTSDTSHASLGDDSILFSDWLYNGIAGAAGVKTANSLFVAMPELSSYSASGNTGCTSWGAASAYLWNSAYQPTVYSTYAGDTGCDIKLTARQAAAFLNHFSDSSWNLQFIRSVALYYAAMSSGNTAAKDTLAYVAIQGYPSLVTTLSDSRCTNAGVNYGNALMVYKYLTVHVPRDIATRGSVVGFHRDRDTGVLSLNPDGTGFQNSGLIARHTIEELLFGYNDTILDQSGTGATYHGLTGVQYPTVEAMLDEKPLGQFSLFTGKSDADLCGALHSNVNGSNVLTRRSDLGVRFDMLAGSWKYYDCDELPWLTTNFGADTCELWDNYSVPLRGMSLGEPMRPFFRTEDEELIFSNVHQRAITLKRRAGDVAHTSMPSVWIPSSDFANHKVHGIPTVRYDFSPDSFWPSEDQPYYLGAPCDQEVCTPSGMQSRQTVDGIPVAFSLPWLCYSDAANTTNVTKTADHEALDCSQMGTQLAVEPFTGLVVDASFKHQVNVLLNTELLDGGLYSGLRSQQVLPVYWFEISKSISGSNRSKLQQALGVADQALWVCAVCVLCGFACFVLGLVRIRRQKIQASKVAVETDDQTDSKAAELPSYTTVDKAEQGQATKTPSLPQHHVPAC